MERRTLLISVWLVAACGCDNPSDDRLKPETDPTGLQVHQSGCGPAGSRIPPIAAEGNPLYVPCEVTEADIPADVFIDSWARLPLLNREALDAEGQHGYDVIVNPNSRYADGPWGPVAMWMYSPEMVEHIFPTGTYLRFGTEKNQRLTELAILATAREVRSQYEWSVHEPAALTAGLEPEIIDIIRNRTPLSTLGDVAGLDEQERVIIQFTREVVSDERLSSLTFRQARELFGARGVMDLAGLVGYYSFVNITLKTFDLQLEPGRDRLLPNFW